MTTQDAASGFEPDDEQPSEETQEMIRKLKVAGFEELSARTPTQIKLLGNHVENIEFGVRFDRAAESLSLLMTAPLKYQRQLIRHQIGDEHRKQQILFSVHSPTVERVIVSLRDELREFYVSYFFDTGVAEITDAYETADDWEMFATVQNLAAPLRDRLLNALPHELPHERDEAMITDRTRTFSASIPFRPSEENYHDAQDFMVIKTLLRLFRKSEAAEEMLNYSDTEQFELVPHYKNGKITLSLQTISMNGNAYDRLLLVSSEDFYRIHPSIVASTLNSMRGEKEKEWRKTIGDTMFHVLMDIMADGGADDITVADIDRFYKKFIAGKLPVILDANFGDIEFEE